MIFGAKLNYCVSRMNPNPANWDLVLPNYKKIKPCWEWCLLGMKQARCQVLVCFRGFRWRSLYALQTTWSQIFPFRIHGLGTWIMSWSFLTFIASIYWNLDNLVSAPLPLEVQFWGRSWSLFNLLTSADMTALGHCSRQAEGGRKLMGQPLVHSQRLGSIVWVSSCLLVSCLCF